MKKIIYQAAVSQRFRNTVLDRTQSAVYASFLSLTLPQYETPSFTYIQNTSQKHKWVISEVLCMVAALCGASYD